MNIIKTFDFWTAALAGQNPQMHDGDVHLGYWRFKTKNHTNGGDAVGIWLEGDAVTCMIGQRVVDNANVFNTKDEAKTRYTLADLMNWLCKNPVSYEDYSAFMDTGNWPGMNAVVSGQERDDAAAAEAGPGHNSGAPQDELAALRDQIDALVGEVNVAIKRGAAKTKEEADAAADLAERLGKLHGKATKARDTEKDPHWNKYKEIMDKWKPVIEESEVYKDVKKTVITPFLVEEERKREQKLAEERAEAKRLQQIADDRAIEAQRALDEAAQQGATEAPPALLVAAQEAEQAQQQAKQAEKKADSTASTSVKVGTRGRSTSLRTETVYEITDRRAASAALKDDPGFLAEIDTVIVKFAKAAIEAGRTVEGVEKKTGQKAA